MLIIHPDWQNKGAKQERITPPFFIASNLVVSWANLEIKCCGLLYGLR
jgi:hypothetical protein